MFRIKRLRVDTLNEHVVFINEAAVRKGHLGFRPLDRVRLLELDAAGDSPREITGVLNFCGDSIVEAEEIGLSEDAFADLGLAEGAAVQATITSSPASVDLIRSRLLHGRRFDQAAFGAILTDVVAHRYSKVELSMFVLACGIRALDAREMVDYTRAMIASGTQLSFGGEPIVDKHCIGGVPGNRTTMIVVPILVSLGLVVPKTSSRAITSPAGTADTMNMLAEVALTPEAMRRVVEKVGGCIAWGGTLGLAPADDLLITVERPMELDSEAHMVASILAKKKTVGATHVLIDIPVGPTTKVRSAAEFERLSRMFQSVAGEIDLHLDVLSTEAHGPIGRGIGPRLEALDVLAVLRGERGAPGDLRDKALRLAGRILEATGAARPQTGFETARQRLDSGAAAAAFERIADAQGRRDLVPPARHVEVVTADGNGLIRDMHCREMARVAKRAGAPANPESGVRLLRGVGDVVRKGEPLFEIHAQSRAQLEFAAQYAKEQADLIRYAPGTAASSARRP